MAWLPLSGPKTIRRRLWMLPLAIGFGVLGYLLSQPLGLVLQARITTEANLGSLRIGEIRLVRRGGNPTIHRVITGY